MSISWLRANLGRILAPAVLLGLVVTAAAQEKSGAQAGAAQDRHTQDGGTDQLLGRQAARDF